MTVEDSVTSLSGWKKAREHDIRLPSGVRVLVVIPDLAALIESGHIPQNLLDAALAATGARGKGDAPTREFILQERDFTNRVVQATVVKPKLTDADLDDVPVEDKALIVEVATRQRDVDAEGNHIGGLHKSEDFRRFRGLDDLDASLEGV